MAKNFSFTHKCRISLFWCLCIIFLVLSNLWIIRELNIIKYMVNEVVCTALEMEENYETK